jgi:hypothetical protein
MAYSVKAGATTEARVLKSPDGQQSLWFEPGTRAVPFFAAQSTSDPAITKAAAEHLNRAIELYRQALELSPANPTVLLGFGWCLEQSGDRAKAITVYRHVVAEGWTREASLGPQGEVINGVSALGTSLTSEAATYLIPLLDRERDREEIATLQERIRVLGLGPRGVTPIIIPLEDNVAVSEMLSPSPRVVFDADGSGARPWTWITPKAGWLVYAPEGSRPVDSALRLFGNVTFWMFWDNGYQALRAIDDDRSGAVNGAELRDLGIWRDVNSNGIAENGEVKPVADWGIVSLAWRHEDTRMRSDYVAFSAAGVTFKDGRSRPTYDVILYTRKAATE